MGYQEMQNTSEAPLVGVFDRQDRFIGIKKRGATLGFQSLKARKRGTWAVMGDSMGSNERSTVGTPETFVSLNSNGPLNWLLALSGGGGRVIANYAVGGKTAVQARDEQLASVVLSGAENVMLSLGHNDLFIAGASGADTAAVIISIMERLIDCGITPHCAGVLARSYQSDALLKQQLLCNDALLSWAVNNPEAVVIDGHRITMDPASAQGANKAGWTLDSAPSIHINQSAAYWLGKSYMVARSKMGLGTGLTRGVSAAADFAKAPELNLLNNPVLAGTTGVAGANVTGNVPTDWGVSWATRTGTGVATVAVVDQVDQDTGAVVGRSLRVNPVGGGGAVAAADELIITNSASLAARLAGGNVIKARATVKANAPVAVRAVRMRVQSNTNEATWWGANLAATGGGSEGTLPEACQLAMETRDMTVLGAGAASQGLFEVRIRFDGATGAGTFDVSAPAVVKVS